MWQSMDTRLIGCGLSLIIVIVSIKWINCWRSASDFCEAKRSQHYGTGFCGQGPWRWKIMGPTFNSIWMMIRLVVRVRLHPFFGAQQFVFREAVPWPIEAWKTCTPVIVTTWWPVFRPTIGRRSLTNYHNAGQNLGTTKMESTWKHDLFSLSFKTSDYFRSTSDPKCRFRRFSGLLFWVW